MRQLITMGLTLLAISSLAQKKIIISKFPNGENRFEYRVLKKFIQNLALNDISETQSPLKIRFNVDHNKVIEIGINDSLTLSAALTLYTTNWIENKKETEQFFLSHHTIPKDTARIIYDLVKEYKIDSLSQLEPAREWGPVHDGRTYTFEFSDPNTYSFKTYSVGNTDAITKQIEYFIHSVNTLLGLNEKLLNFIKRLPPQNCYQVSGEERKVICPGDRIKEKKLNNN